MAACDEEYLVPGDKVRACVIAWDQWRRARGSTKVPHSTFLARTEAIAAQVWPESMWVLLRAFRQALAKRPRVRRDVRVVSSPASTILISTKSAAKDDKQLELF